MTNRALEMTGNGSPTLASVANILVATHWIIE
jgi:hypothetical protein